MTDRDAEFTAYLQARQGARIRDAHSGAIVAEVTGERVPSYVWEDSSHLLAVVVAEDGSTSLQRIGVDGAPETLLDGFMTTGEDPSPRSRCRSRDRFVTESRRQPDVDRR